MSSQRQIESARLAHATDLVHQAVQNYKEAKYDHDRLFGEPSFNPFGALVQANPGQMITPGDA